MKSGNRSGVSSRWPALRPAAALLFALLLLAAGPVRAEGADPALNRPYLDLKTFVENILRRAREAGFENVTGIVNSQVEAGLAADSVDLAFVCDTYHHFERPQAMLRSKRRALRPGGALVVIDAEFLPQIRAQRLTARAVRAQGPAGAGGDHQ
jgi:SAM-dependent methyltransferase